MAVILTAEGAALIGGSESIPKGSYSESRMGSTIMAGEIFHNLTMEKGRGGGKLQKSKV